MNYITALIVFACVMENSFPLGFDPLNINTNSQYLLYSFLTKLVNQKFSNCSLISLNDYSISNSDFDSMLNEIVIGKYLVNLNKLVRNVNDTSTSFQLKTPKAQTYSSRCIVALIFLPRINPKLVELVQKLLAPLFKPIMRNDEDHYVFVTPAKNHEKLLLMKELPHRTKFKIAVGVNKMDRLAVSSIDFFGGLNASFHLIQFYIDEQINPDELELFPDYLWDFHGALIRITLPITKCMVEADATKNVNNAARGRWTYLIDEYLMRKFNFTYYMFLATDINGRIGAGGTGFQAKNGTWIGMTGDLLYGRAELGVAIANTEKRNQFIGFTDTHFDFGCLTFVTGQPVTVYSTMAMFWPFDTLTWLCIMVSCIVALIFIVAVKAILQRVYATYFAFGFTSYVRILLAPFLEQDYTAVPASTPFRCFVAFWSFFAMVVTNFYRSKLVTLLAFPVLGRLPETFEELAFSDFQIGFMKHGDSALNTIKASADPVYVNLLKKIEIIEGVGLECLRNVVTYDKYGCIAYDFDVIYLKARNFTDADSRKLVTAARGRTYNIWLGLGTQAYSIYRPNFGKVLGYTMPFHLAHIWDKMDRVENVRKVKFKWWKETNQTEKLLSTDHNEYGSKNELTLEHIRGIFYVLVGSMIIGSLIFINELLYLYIRRKCPLNK